MKVIGFIEFIDEEKQVTEKFKVRNFCVRTEDEMNGRTYVNHISMQFTQKDVTELDSVNINDKVEVTYSLEGRVDTNKDKAGTEKNPDSKRCITNNNAYGIIVLEKAAVAGAAPSAEGAVTGAEPEKKDNLPF